MTYQMTYLYSNKLFYFILIIISTKKNENHCEVFKENRRKFTIAIIETTKSKFILF